MIALFWLVLAAGVAPLAIGLARLPRAQRALGLDLASIILCALAFNLTFFWQELWLVIPKALAGLHPVLFHNDHDWTGDAPIAELLQGTGMLGTLDSGIAFAMALALGKQVSPPWRLFFFWMAFQGLFQSLSQLAIGTLIPGNDVGRALAYLRIGGPAKAALLVLSVIGMAYAGVWLARRRPFGTVEADRALGWSLLAVTMLSIVLITPFRMPRHPIEVVLIPVVVNLIGAGWLILGASLAKAAPGGTARVGLLRPALALAALLAVFQLVLRPGIAF